ncbi:hypothetical protein CI105_08530 [Candidatus Izimaplasma bacterium ZiA1]|uniref:hypothetical protein n=1 Tax=Candidatus Izimoplasma sp. ZiA1 TaxID=2024899 RepID=UPI000BAA5EE1|nr:hypothetical protein CI105_08530 [Candidatus Izimaplasma bacterium ZiA1]
MKKCINCGSVVTRNNEVKVFPEWLIKKTGDITRDLTLGVDLKAILEQELKPRVLTLPYLSFTTVECEKCTTTYFDDIIESVFKKVENSLELDIEEVNILLDWFDKLRISLWLGEYKMSSNPFNIKPSFGVKTRMGTKDRILVVYNLKEDKGLNILGANTPIFHNSQICFGLRVNDLFFISISTDNIVAKNVNGIVNNGLGIMKDDELIILKNDLKSKESDTPIEGLSLLETGKVIAQHIHPVRVDGKPLDFTKPVEMKDIKFEKETFVKRDGSFIGFSENDKYTLIDQTKIDWVENSMNLSNCVLDVQKDVYDFLYNQMFPNKDQADERMLKYFEYIKTLQETLREVTNKGVQ